MHRAPSNGHTAIAEQLIGNGADIDAKALFGWTPLYLVASPGHAAIAELLIAKGADIDAQDDVGSTA